jgi:hypothetical protein
MLAILSQDVSLLFQYLLLQDKYILLRTFSNTDNEVENLSVASLSFHHH